MRCRGTALYSRRLPLIPEADVEHPRRHARALGELFARVQRAGADLALGGALRQQLAGVDVGGQLGVVAQHAVHAQHVGDEVVREDREPIEVVELGRAGESEVAAHDLGALVEAAIVEEAHAAGEQRRQPLGRPVRLADQVPGGAVAQEPAQVAQRLRVQAHQRMARFLAEHARDGGGVEPAQLPVRPGAVLAEGRGDRAVAR